MVAPSQISIRLLQVAIPPSGNLTSPDTRLLRVFPPYWKPGNSFMVGVTVVFGIWKLLIVALQIFMIFVRPFVPSLRENKWSFWFVSSILSMQFFMVMGMVEGNYGGLVDAINIKIFQNFKAFFWLDLSINWSSEFDQGWRAALWGRFEASNYAPSPLQEHYIEIALLSVILIAFLATGKFPSIHTPLKHMRMAATLVFMVPLLLSSFYCLGVVIFLRMTDPFAFGSLLLSVAIIVFYSFEYLNSLTGCLQNKMSLGDGTFEDFDLAASNRFSYGVLNKWEWSFYMGLVASLALLGKLLAASSLAVTLLCAVMLGFSITVFCYPVDK